MIIPFTSFLRAKVIRARKALVNVTEIAAEKYDEDFSFFPKDFLP